MTNSCNLAGACHSILPSRIILKRNELLWHRPNCYSNCICDIVVILGTKVGRRACLGYPWSKPKFYIIPKIQHKFHSSSQITDPWVVELQGIVVTGLSYYVMTWSIKKKGPVFASAFDPLLVVFSFFLQTFVLGNSAYLGRYVYSDALKCMSPFFCDPPYLYHYNMVKLLMEK